MSDVSGSAFGSFLRSRRERLRPEAVGLAPGRRRRTAGLRREEVAERAGIGIDWYTRLEQGRMVRPSGTTVDALARALCLSEAEHCHLRDLAMAAGRPPFRTETVSPALARIVAGLNQPAYVTGQRWDVLAWNSAAADLLGFDRLPDPDRNVILSMLTNPKARQLFGDGWAREARRMLTEFRVDYDLWAGDPAFADLLERLRAGCPEFEGWWRGHDVGKGQAGVKLLHHPRQGTRRFEYAAFRVNDDPALKLAIYTPAGDR